MKRFLLSIFLLLSFFATSLFAVTPDPVKNDEGEASKTDPNRSFEAYTSTELREYIAKLPQTETDPEVLEFEKLALNSSEYLRPLEMSLYYQGWGKDVFYQFGEDLYFYFYDISIPTNKQMREGKGEIRNAKKAFLFALLANSERGLYISKWNLAYLYYEGIGTAQNFERVKEFYRTSVEKNSSPNNNYIFFAYLLWYGKAEFEADKNRAYMLISELINPFWRNAYVGFMMPKDRKFVEEILTYRKDSAFSENILVKIYSGKFDKSDFDEVKAKKYFLLAKRDADKIKENVEKSEHYPKFKNIYNKLNKYKYYEYPFDIPNPEYSKDAVLEYILKVARKSNGNISDFERRLSSIPVHFYPEDKLELLPKFKEENLFSEKDLLLYEKKYKARILINERYH